MIIKSFGCSFIYGTDLADAGQGGDPHHTASQHTWPAVIARNLGAGYQCKALGGYGNLYIMYSVLARAAEHTPDKHDVYVIGWTYSSRFDYVDPAHPGDETPRSAWRTMSSQDHGEFAEIWYRDYHSELRDKITTLQCMITVIDLLERLDIPFVMTCMDPLVMDTTWHAPPAVSLMQQRVRPWISMFQGRDFLTWSRDQGFDIGATGHPLEAAHRAAADLMLPKFQGLAKTK